ncbi:Hypothetical protein of L-Asparaginase type 2-like superfamily [hydrothermal vent metagenome]|uniref:Asparaginase n=1 Tax=hydrothermal vent metagenome TaxID=652676 RepID=A0A3B0TYX4_9ZZZZ
MIANPVLVETIRNNWVENRHRGAFCITNDHGEIIASAGDIEQSIFPRSAIKSIQALALFRSGAVEKFSLDPQEIALACASHRGEAAHIKGVKKFLEKISCCETDLECGAHFPSDPVARAAMHKAGVKPGPIHNNCSGKHSGMLAVARALDAPIKGYIGLDHPVQKLVRQCIEDLIGEDLTTDRYGTDGCSIPTFAAPLKAFAFGFARAGTGNGLNEKTAAAMRQIFAAATSHPFLVGGTGSFDSEVMKIFNGAIMSKRGAEGVYCGSIPALKLGYALKCDDGSMDAAEIMMATLLLDIVQPDAAQRQFLQQRTHKIYKNWRKMEVATMGPSRELSF